LLGKGSSEEVYKYQDKNSKQLVAVKIIEVKSSDIEKKEFLESEIQILKQL